MFKKKASLFYYFPKKIFNPSKSIIPGIPANPPAESVIRLIGNVMPDAIPTRLTAHKAPNPCRAVRKKHLIGCFDLNANITVVSIVRTNERTIIIFIPVDIAKLLITSY